MRKYRVTVKGHNYLLPYDGEPRKMGFTAIRVIRAGDPEEAGQLALGLLVRDPRLVRDLLNGSADPSSLQVESVQRLGLFRSLSRTPQKLEFFFEDLAETPVLCEEAS